MTVRVLFFAALRERLQRAETSLDLSDGATVAEMWASLCKQYSGLADLRGPVSFAVNREYVGKEHHLAPGDEVALLPPVSGG